MDIARSQFQPLQQQRNKVRNVLVRYGGSKKVRSDCLADKNYQHPENAYLVKYSPKYYQNLALVMKPGNFLTSKIKRIKKLKRFSGNFNDRLPQANWSKILANSRKEIEEIPQTHLSQAHRFFLAEATLRAVKFFLKITKLQLPTYKCQEFKSKQYLAIWEAFLKHSRNMRSLKILEIDTHGPNFDVLKQLLKKLNRMTGLLGKLEVLKCPLRCDAPQNIFLQNQKTFSHLTNLHYVLVPSKLSQINQAIPQICKNLNSFSFKFDTLSHSDPNAAGLPQFPNFITTIQELPKLRSISIQWSGSCPHNFWSNFVPPASLKRFKLHFEAQDMKKVVFQVSPTHECVSFFDHWKEIKELDALEFCISCRDGDDMLFTKSFITAMLKKVSRLTSFQCRIDLAYEEGTWRYEPFYIEEVSHLYEYLKKFKVIFNPFESLVRFDFGFLKPFKNLKEIDFKGSPCYLVNIGDAIRLLEGNMKNGEFSTLKLDKLRIDSKEELRSLLKKISKAKETQTNLKIILAFGFIIQAGDDEILYLDQFCQVIEAYIINGLEISLDMRYQDYCDCNVDEVKRVLEKYPGLKNFVVEIHYNQAMLQFIKRDGEKEQLLSYPEDN